MHTLHNIFPQAGTLPLEFNAAILDVEAITGEGTVVLSGGALRDWGHGVPVKDIDLFVAHSERHVEAVDASFITRGWSRIQNIPPSCEGLGEVVAVLGYAFPGRLDINIVFLAADVDLSPLGIAGRNDFGICQIAAWLEGGEWRFDYTEAFLQDVMEKTFTLTRAGDEARSLRRYERLQVKYPAYRLATPYINPANLLPV